MEKELKPCPFCGMKLYHVLGKRVNRFYNGEPTMYKHPRTNKCLLGVEWKEIEIWERDIERWNRRKV